MEEFDIFFIACLLLFTLLLVLIILIHWLSKNQKIRGTIRIVIWNLLLSSIGIMSIFLIGEAYHRFFVDTTDSFAINKISKRWISRHVKRNNSYVRDNINYFPEIAKGKRRLTIIGDSFSNGHGVEDISSTYASIIRKKYGDKIEVHNFSLSGASSYTQLNNIKHLVEAGYEFDVILLAYCLNDIDYYVNETKGIYKRIHSFGSNLSYVSKNSYFINSLVFRLFAMKDPDVMNYSNFVLKGYNGYSWELQKEKLREIKQFVIDQKANLVVFTFPFLQEKKEDYLFRQAHENLGSFWKSEGITHIDLLKTYEPYFGDRLTVNQYDAHPNEFAHQLAANEIERVLQKKNTP